jgi:hypothetical protein
VSMRTSLIGSRRRAQVTKRELTRSYVHTKKKPPNPTVNSDVPVKVFIVVDVSGGTPVTWFR